MDFGVSAGLICLKQIDKRYGFDRFGNCVCSVLGGSVAVPILQTDSDVLEKAKKWAVILLYGLCRKNSELKMEQQQNIPSCFKAYDFRGRAPDELDMA